jgi:hypothetical protein
MRRAVATLGLLCALVVAPIARADGDPASDWLLAAQAFLPYDAKFSKAQQVGFTNVLGAVNKAGFKIRVAVIYSSYDMGSVTSLYGKPKQYARFLAIEIGFIYKERLLIVMPQGFGFNRPKHSSAAEYALLSKIPIRPGPSGLLATAQTAVVRLAAADGVKVAASGTGPTASPAHRNSQDRLTIIIAALGGLAAAAALRLVLLRRRRGTRPH